MKFSNEEFLKENLFSGRGNRFPLIMAYAGTGVHGFKW